MGDYNSPPELARLLAELAGRVAVLERFGLEALHYIDTAGEPAFQNSWVNFDAGTPGVTAGMRAAAFYRHDGRVYLTGLIKTGTSGTTAFTLPPGYRPVPQDVTFLTVAGGAVVTGYVQIGSGGGVTPTNVEGSVTTFCYLDAVSFRHA